MDMQITPIIPTTDTLIGEAVSLAKVAGKWLMRRIVKLFCTTFYHDVMLVPFKSLSMHGCYGENQVTEAGFCWIPGVGLGYINVVTKPLIRIPNVDKRIPNSWGCGVRLTDTVELTIPKYKYAAYAAKHNALHASDFKEIEFDVASLEVSAHVMAFLRAVQAWKRNRAWYKSRKIPYTLGVVLYGPPGSGKTTIVKTIGAILGRSPVIMPMQSNDAFEKAASSVDGIWLIEDIDGVFNKRENVSKASTLTFDVLLNALSGVDSKGNRIIIITTNHPETLDPALAHIPTDGSPPVPRPGRIDHIVYVGPLDKEARERVVARVFPDRPDLWHDLVVAGEGETIALFQARCVTLALELKAKENT